MKSINTTKIPKSSFLTLIGGIGYNLIYTISCSHCAIVISQGSFTVFESAFRLL